MTIQLRIEPATEGKGRTFTAQLIAYARADSIWTGGNHDDDIIRPVWAMIATREAETRPFIANLTMGRKAILGDSTWRRRGGAKLECLKSADYRVEYQRHPEGIVSTIYLPDFFRADGCLVDPEKCTFVMLAPKEWAAAQSVDRAAIARHLAKIYPDADKAKLAESAAYGVLFGVRLDRLTRAPLVADPRFYAQVMFACLREGLASYPCERYSRDKFGEHSRLCFKADGLETIGIEPTAAIAMHAAQTDVEKLLASEVEVYFNLCPKGKAA